ncbi:MAG TPA: ABC transporter permease [Vicinamibacterales bacterium]|nr:ABC transporter permease [Vicinamibacterales bacterium]
MTGFVHDVKHGFRMLFKNPGFTFIAVLSIAIGVGANAAMFSVADGLVIRPLPVPRPGEVVTVSADLPGFIRNTALSYPEYTDFKTQSQSLTGLVAYQLVLTTFVNRPDEPALRRAGMVVSGNYFDAMEVRPALGRWFRADEDEVPLRDAVIVLDYDEWQQTFAADPAIINRRLRVGTADFTVIGVAPAGFTSIDHDLHPAFYIPLSMAPAVQTGRPVDARLMRDLRWLVIKGRLKPGVSIAQAREDVRLIALRLERSYPDTNRNRRFTVQTQLDAFTSGPGGTDAALIGMLMTLAVVVLVVACANVAGLLTSRAPVRSREIALRLAVGAARFRLMRQLVTESLLIAAGGGALGLLFGYGVIRMFQRLEFPADVPLKLTFALDGRVIAVGIILATAAALISSVIPAWRSTRSDLVSTIKDPNAITSPRQRFWGRSLLVSGQIALSLVLLTVSAFLYRSFNAELEKGPGFRTDHLLMVTFEPSLLRYDETQSRSFYRRLKETMAVAPGVTSVSLSSTAPMKASEIGFGLFAPEGFQFPPGRDNANVATIDADEQYFDTLEIPILKGRGFRATDTADAPRVAIVNQTFASHYWPGQDPIGKRVRLDSANRAYAEIVGVAADAKYIFIVESPVELIYLSHMQGAAPRSTLLVSTAGAPADMAAQAREVVRSIEPNMPLLAVRTLDDFYASRIVYTTRLLVGSVIGMGVMGLVLAMVGLYGLVAYNARRRTREIGIRVAVGANPAAVLRMILRHGFTLAVAGIVVGLIGSVAANGALRATFSRTPFGRLGAIVGSDLAVYLQVVAVLILVVAFAAYFPARRAARVDPLVALKTE